MANYLVASGSRKISQLEVALDPTPSGSGSVLPMVIGDTFPITNGTTVQIRPDDFLHKLVWNASNEYSQSNTFSGNNEFTANNTFTGTNEFSPITTFNGVVFVSGSARYTGSIFVDGSSASFSESETTFTNQVSLLPYQTTIKGGSITISDILGNEGAKLKSENGNGFLFQDYNGTSYDTFLQVQSSQGDVHIKRNTVISGSLTVQEVFYVYETASVLNSSGSSKVGDSGDDTHQFSGSILLSGSLAIIDGGTLDGVDLSVFSSSVQIESQSFASRVTQNEDDITLLSASFEATSSQIFDDVDYLSGSYETFSGSQYKFDSGSFSADITENSQSLSLLSSSYENFSGSQYNTDSSSFSADITENSQSLSLLSSSYENFSGSQYNTDSSSLSVRLTQNEGDISLLSGSYETFSGSQYNTDSGSVSIRLTQNEGDISLLSSSYETFSGSQYNADSSSVSTRVTSLESFSASLDSTYATDAELATVSQSFETDIDNLSGSISTRFIGNETDISNLQTDSGSFSTRVTNNETDISNLQTDSGSFSTRVTTNETNISNLQTDSGSFSTRVTTNETDISNLQTDSGSFSTRVTDQESFSSSFDSNVLEYNNSVGVVSGSSQVVFNDTSFNPFISTSAAISASNHLIPSENEVYDLGTPTQRWRDLYLSGSTIDLGGLLIQKGADGNVQFIDSASQATKSVTIDSITGSLTVTENLTVGGNITAQQFYTEYVTSSVIFESGSTKFGDTSDDIHQFTGSLSVSGSGSEVTGSITILGDIDIVSPTGTNNILIGKGAAINEPTAEDSVIIGYEAGANSDATGNQNDNVSIGYRAGYNANGGSSTFVGSQAGYGGGAFGGGGFGSGNTGIGNLSLYNIDGGDYNTAIGSQAGNYLAGGSNNIFIGKGTNTSFGTYAADNYQIAIGINVPTRGTGTTVIGTPGQTTHTYLEGLITGSSLEIGGDITASNAVFDGNVEVTGSFDVSGSINVTSHGADGIILNADVNNGPTSGRVIFMNDSGAGYTIMNELGRLSFRSGSIPGSTSGVEKARLLSNDDFELTSGNFKVANGNGIDFSAVTGPVSGSSTSQLLDDYEEGTFTPIITDNTSGGNDGSISYKNGFYTKIGRLVTLQVTMSSLYTTGMTSGNTLYVKGLPFAIAYDLQTSYGSCNVSNVSFNDFVSAVIDSGTSTDRVFFRTYTSGSNAATLKVSDITNAAGALSFTIQYHTT